MALNKKYSLVSLCLVSLMVSVVVVKTQIFPQSPDPEQHGPEIDKLRFQTIKSPEAQLVAMQTNQTDILPDITWGGRDGYYELGPKIEELYVDGINEWYFEWDTVGTAPWLDAAGDGNYIVGTFDGAFMFWFEFENITLGDRVIGDVILEAYTDGPYNEDIDYDAYAGNFAWLGSLYATGAPAWVSPRWLEPGETVGTIYPDALTEEGLNSFHVGLYFYDPGGATLGNDIVDCLRLSVYERGEYIPPVPPALEKLQSEGYTITASNGFHIAHVGFNLHRPILGDVNFRHALFLGYNQDEIISSIYGWKVKPAQSLVPLAQGGWMAPDIPRYQFNPGTHLDPPGTESVFGVLKGAGYTYHGTGYGDLTAYWTDPYGDPLPAMTFYTPTYEVAPTSAEHGARITDEWHRCGLNNIDHAPADFGTYTHLVFDLHDFDIYMIAWTLDRFPTQLYWMCHSSEYVLGSDHAVGIQDPTLDGYLETLMYSLDHDAKVAACHEAQRHLYDATHPWGLPYMNLYSRVLINAFNPGLRGIVNMPGYGSDNMWTLLNMHWEPGHPNERIEAGESVIIYCNGEEAPNRSPLSSANRYERNVIGPVFDGLIAENPYDLTDVPWQAESWTIVGPITETITLDSDIDGGPYAGMNAGDSFNIIDGMKITFDLVDGMYWQDGNAIDAGDCEFSLEFLRDNEIPGYIWRDIVDVQRIDADEFVVYANVTSQFLLYKWADAALLLAPQVWSTWDGQPLPDILGYDPSTDYTDTGPWSYPDGPDNVPGTGDDPDPTNIGPKTTLFGTGPFVYDYYDPLGMVAELHAWREDLPNVGYFKTTQQVDDLKTELFHYCGDVNRDGVVDLVDHDRWEAAYLSSPGDPNWDPDADLNEDSYIDYKDSAIIHSGWGDAREYPAEIYDVEILDVTTYPIAIPGQQVEISLTARYKGLIDREVNFTYYYNDTLLGYQDVTWAPGEHTLSFTWDTTSVPIGTYQIKVNSEILDYPDPPGARLSDPTYLDGYIDLVTPRISVAPLKSIVGSAGKAFSVNVTLTDAPYNYTWAWQFKLSWDPTLLNITGIDEGTFLNQDGTWATTFVNVTNQDEGWVQATCTLYEDPIQLGQPLPYGNGSLASINFTVLEPENGTLHLYDTVLLDYNIDPYSHTTQDGEFEVLLGDINRDGIVDEADLAILEDAFITYNPEADIWGPGDEPDGVIDVYDLAMWGKKYGETA